MASLDGKVAVVTGAGRGLGRAHALELARQGAHVVVNDIGAALDGTSTEEQPAQQVVDEITSAGGEAAAHYGDVSSWDDAKGLLDFAVEKFGSLEIVVNNAGILRDRMIFNMTEEDWDAVLKVHLKGHFCTTRHATSYWREQSKASGQPAYGRIINTSSEAFLFGSAGQPNYAAAKAGITALTLATAQSCWRYGITANAICPRALTRMTEPMGLDPAMFAPEHTAALVAFLASPEAAQVSGQVFVVWGGTLRVMGEPPVDEEFVSEGAWSAEDIKERLVPFYEKREPVMDGFVVRP
jgi:NAD(P)-dependent dehydrogenase (short-subunit alcohol dehydrogenase family)